MSSMRVFRGFDEIINLNSPVAAIGSFDGVHLGHRRILKQLCESAKRLHGDSVVVTFDPHPQQVLHPDSDFFMINTLEDNLKLIASQGVDATVIIPFTKDFSQLSYADFIDRIIIGKIHVRALVMGPNHAFGHNREGDHDSIEQLCLQRGVQIVDIPEFVLHDAGVRSAKIRGYIRENNFLKVEEMLGYPYQNKVNK